MKLGKIADLINAKIVGDSEIEITGACGIKEAKNGDITFLADKKNIKYIHTTDASAIIVRDEIKESPKSMLIVDNPHLAFAKVLEIFYKKPFAPLGISDKAVIGKDVNLGENVTIYPLAYISNNINIGARVIIFPGVYIGEGVSIGDDSIIYPNVTIRENVIIGKRVIIHAGTVIGSDGFGYVFEKGQHYKIPQIGGVVIEDDVEIGANVTIDRATTGNTLIGSGTKIDNLVQIGHNVKIGKNCIIIAQVGIGGSVEIGNNVILAGQVGIRDHVKISDNVKVGAQSGVAHDIPRDEIFSGTPAIPHKTWLRAQNIYNKLPNYIKRLKELESRIKKS